MVINPTAGYKVAFPTDEHFPFQDNRAREVALQIVEDFEPDLLVCGSDGIDFYSISKFDKDPKRSFNIQDEINAWKAGMREWVSAAPDARRVFIPGNHEDRLRRYIWRHPEMVGLEALQLHNVLGLDLMGIESEEMVIGENYGQSEVEIGPVVIKHGTTVRKHSAYTARGEMEREFYGVPVLFTGHTHRGGTHMATTRQGLVRAYECFCLCDINPSYVNSPNWQQGIAIATIYGTLVQVEAIPIIESNGIKRAVWRDRIYTA
jgi:hypothetical protein